MPENPTKLLPQLLSAARLDQIDHWIAKYPAEEKQFSSNSRFDDCAGGEGLFNSRIHGCSC